MPKNKITGVTGWKKEIRAFCDAHGIPKSDSQISRLATKASKRELKAESSDRADFYDAMRILGIVTDTTARDAVRNLETINHWRVAL